MATSGSTNFTSTRNDLIYDALRRINAIGENETPSAYDLQLANRVLNRMVKSWEQDGIHLWAKSQATLFLQKDQNTYQIYSSGDHASETSYATTLTADAASGATSLTVSDTSNMTVSDYIGIELDDSSLQWSTIATIPDSTTVTINNALTDDAASGNVVYNYTTRLDQPVKIYSANRRDSDNLDVPLMEYSYQQFFELPTKENTGIPNTYNFDKQRDYAVIRVWQTPANVDYRLVFTFSRKIQDFDNAADNPDLPQETHQCLLLNLAENLAGFYGKDQGEKYQALVMKAQNELNKMLEFDNERGSIYIQPNYDGESY